MSKKRTVVAACPECSGHRIGRISNNLFYCGDCCLELHIQPARRRIELFRIDEDGNQVSVGSRNFDELVRPPQAVHF